MVFLCFIPYIIVISLIKKDRIHIQDLCAILGRFSLAYLTVAVPYISRSKTMEDKVARYSIGWIAPLPLELTAAKAVLDEDHGDIHVGDYIYHGGRIGKHHVVMAVQPKMARMRPQISLLGYVLRSETLSISSLLGSEAEYPVMVPPVRSLILYLEM